MYVCPGILVSPGGRIAYRYSTRSQQESLSYLNPPQKETSGPVTQPTFLSIHQRLNCDSVLKGNPTAYTKLAIANPFCLQPRRTHRSKAHRLLVPFCPPCHPSLSSLTLGVTHLLSLQKYGVVIDPSITSPPFPPRASMINTSFLSFSPISFRFRAASYISRLVVL